MKKKINDQTLNIRIPNALHEQLKLVAESQYMPMSVMIRLALGEYVRTHATVALARVAVNPQQDGKPNSNAPKSPAQQAWEDEWNY